MADSSKPSWRRQKSPRGGRRAVVGDGSRVWQSRKVDSGKSAAAYHRLKLLGLGTLAGLLIVAFIIIVVFWPRKVPIHAIVVTEYHEAIPPNEYARDDVLRLSRANGKSIRMTDMCMNTVGRSRFWQFLDDRLSQRPGGPGHDTVIIYLSAQGIVDENAQPCLLLSDSDPLDSKTWLPMKEVIAKLSETPKTRKVLILDAAKIDTNWRMGVLLNGFAEGLAELTAAAKNVYILNSTQGHQRSWSAPELDASVFGHFVTEGLRGAASEDDNKVTLGELFDYVRSNVERWTLEHRASRQVPMLVPSVSANDDFPIVYRGKPLNDEEQQVQRERVAKSRGRIDEHWKRVHGLWKRLESTIKNRALYRTDPVTVAQLQRQLLRLEQLLLAGEAYAEEFDATSNLVASTLSSLAEGNLPDGLHAFSLPLIAQWEDTPDVANEVAQWVNAGGKPPAEQPASKRPLDYATAGTIAWEFLSQHPEAGVRQIRDALSLVDKTKGRTARDGTRLAEPVEIHFLRMLERYLDQIPADGGSSRTAGGLVHKALQARYFAETAAAPEDSRVHYWVQPLLNRADQERRRAEDLMFVGDPQANQTAQASLVQLTDRDSNNGFPSAIDRARQIASLFELRDRAWAEAPFLVEWVLRQGPDGRSERITTPLNELLDDALTSIRQNHALAAALDTATVEGNLDLSEQLQTLSADLEQATSRLQKTYAVYCQYLKVGAGPDAPTSREIRDVLRLPTPLIAADERSELSGIMLDIYYSQSGLSDVTTSESTSAARVPEQDARRAQWLSEMTPHPAVQLLDRSRLELLLNFWTPAAELQRSDDSAAKWLARQGALVRKTLVDIQQFSEDLEDVTNVRLREASETAANTRAGASEADRLVRAASTLLGSPIPDPAHRLREVDQHFHVLWRCQRTLDDFWGPSTIPGSGSTSYFDHVASAQLKSARLFDDTPTRLVYRNADLSELLRQRRAAANGSQIEPTEVRTLGEEPLAPHQVGVRWHTDLPKGGVAALYLQQSDSAEDAKTIPVKDSDLADRRRQGCTPGTPPLATVRHYIATKELPQDRTSTTLSANMLFRGHLMEAPFSIRWPEQVLVTRIEPRRVPDAKVTVQGNVRRRAWIMFILDCSASMGSGNRFGKAQQSLQQTLDALLLANQYHVGLSAYGHRSRWKDVNGKRVPVFKDELPAAARPRSPDEDFQSLVGMEQLDQNHHAKLNAALQKLRPYGVTPLYWSLKECLRNEFDIARPGDAKHIILITDGLNWQNKTNTLPADVLKAWRDKENLRIDILFLDKEAVVKAPNVIKTFAGGVDEMKRHIRDLEQLAKSTGGNYFEPDAQALTEALRETLKLVKFSVADSGSPQVPDAARLDLGRAHLLNDLRPGRHDYRVELHDAKRPAEATVEIEGGEWLLLEYDEALDRLVFPEYDPGDARAKVDIPDPLTTDRYRVTAILPEKNRSRVTFFVAIQKQGKGDDEWQFTRRPEHVWTTIQPLLESGRPLGAPYHFYDPLFVAGVPVAGQPAPDRPVPVPVFRFPIAEWPDQATQAAIQINFRYDVPPIEPNGREELDPVAPVDIQEDIPNVTFQAEMKHVGEGREGYRATVWERHDRDTDLYSARVQANPTPDRIAHTYYLGVDTVKHEFDYREATRPTITIVSRDRIFDGAMVAPTLKVQVKE